MKSIGTEFSRPNGFLGSSTGHVWGCSILLLLLSFCDMFVSMVVDPVHPY